MSIEAMKQALEALEEINKLSVGENAICLPAEIDGAMDSLRQAISEAEQDGQCKHCTNGCVACDARFVEAKQEPVVWMYQDKSTHEVRFQKNMRGFVDHGQTYETPLYTTPPQRQWVELTDDEVVHLKMLGRDLEFVSITALRRFARDIAQALKEKNT